MRPVAFFLLLLASPLAAGQNTASPDLPVVVHRRVPETYCELLERGILHLANSGIVLRLDNSGEPLHPSAFSHSLGFLEYDPNDLSSDDRENTFYAARSAGFQLEEVRQPSSMETLPTLRQAKSMPGGTCTDLKTAHAVLAGQPVPEQVYSAGSKNMTAPQRVTEVQTKYSQAAKKKGIQGNVVVTFILQETGVPTYLFVSQSLDPDLDQSAIDAVRLWRFQPAMKDDHPVATVVNVNVHFGLY